MTPRQILMLILLSSFWGGSFLFMRIAAPALGPVLLVELRVLIAGLALLGFAYLFRMKLPDFRANLRHYLIIGGLNSAMPFLLISTASVYLPASLTATLNATTPLCGMIVASFWLGEQLTARKVGGLLVGLGGVAVLMGAGPVELTPTNLLAAGASVLGASCYGIAAVYTKAKVRGGEPLAIATFSQLCAALLVLPFVPFSLPAEPPSLLVIGSMLALAILCTAIGYMLYFNLIINAGPTKATMVTYLSPAFGMLWGALLLREPLALGNFIGFALILVSVAVVSRAPTPVPSEQQASG